MCHSDYHFFVYSLFFICCFFIFFFFFFFFFSSRRRQTRLVSDWSSDVCSSDLQLMSAWPEAIKQALAELSNATISLPADELEQALKRGKILFPWKRVRALVNPPLPPSAEIGRASCRERV